MARKKSKKNKAERREERLRKARQWVLTYEGKHIVKAYRNRFKVDITCALNDLGEIGALNPAELAVKRKAEEARLEQKRREREQKAIRELHERFPDSDDYFYYIAGYTPGGAPYGVTWEEMGLEPWTSPEDDIW